MLLLAELLWLQCTISRARRPAARPTGNRGRGGDDELCTPEPQINAKPSYVGHAVVEGDRSDL
jgi:hypothetical protein